ncbi:MAG TPA: RodZ domain-containing protein, partial [Acidimicrobiales bacterium]|nr:RodZ domain-containing protein [Acidimicrobiales bacterium]
QPSTPADTGVALLRARQALGLGLTDVRDRTGVSIAVLEALETGDLSRAPSREAVVVGLRRYADLVNLDGEALVATIEPYWGSDALVGATSRSAFGLDTRYGQGTGANPPVTGGFAGHLRQYPDRATHLEAFTRTAQTPAVGGSSGSVSAAGWLGFYGTGQVLGQTGMYPATPALRIRQVVRPAAWPVRVLVWTAVATLAIAGAGLVLAHVRPQWLRDAHLARVPHSASATSGSVTKEANGAPSTPSTTPASNSLVSTGVPGPTGTPVVVQSAQYTVVLATSAPCWVEATAPGTPAVFNQTLPAGAKQVLTPVNGQIDVELGSAGATVAVSLNGKIVPGWSFAPTTAPVTLLFTNAAGPIGGASTTVTTPAP